MRQLIKLTLYSVAFESYASWEISQFEKVSLFTNPKKERTVNFKIIITFSFFFNLTFLEEKRRNQRRL